MTDTAQVDDLPSKSQPRRIGPALVICLVFLAGAIPLIAAGHERGRGAADQNQYHLVAIRTFARQWPRFDLHDYASATTPGYHLLLAFVDKFISDDVRVLRLFGMLFTLGLLATLAVAVGGRVPPEVAIALCLPAACSIYVFSSGAWLLPDNVAWWGVLAILLLALRARVDVWTYVLGGILLAILVLVRQSDAWAAAVLWVAAWRGSASENSAPLDIRAATVRVGWMALATVPAAAVVLWFIHLWHGLLPVGMQSFHGGANPAVPATVLGVFGILAIFFSPFAAPARVPRRVLSIAAGAAVGFIAAAVPVMTYSHPQGRESGIWNLVPYLPVVHQRSIVMLALAALGGALLVIWLLSLETRDRWIFLITWLAFIAAQTENTKAWQRYYEPFVLIVLPLMASRVIARHKTWPGPVAIAAPLILAILLAAITAAGLRRGEAAKNVDWLSEQCVLRDYRGIDLIYTVEPIAQRDAELMAAHCKEHNQRVIFRRHRKKVRMFEQWLKCNVFKGMFNDELAVQVVEKRGGEVSFFVPKASVRCDSASSGTVKVRVFREGGTAWAVFPSEDSTAVPVNDSDLAGV